MARAGDELVNPATGLRTLFRRTAAETDGELLQVDWIAAPGWTTGPPFEALAGLARDGKTTKAGIPKNPLQAAVIVREFEDEIYFVRPPLALQKLIFGPLAGLGRLLGYRPDYRYRRDRADEAAVAA